MTRPRIVAGNWKMHLTLAASDALATELRNRLGSHRGTGLVVFPPFPYLPTVQQRLRDCAIQVGAQDLHPMPRGAYTSGVSGEMIRSIGCSRVLVGHSERRAWFGDSPERVAEKLHQALEVGLEPVLCIGETLDARRGGSTNDVLSHQLDSALGAHSAARLSALVLAYEPVWAIGTGVTASPEQAQDTHAFIRGFLASHFGAAFAAQLCIQYGGSVTADNAAALLACDDIDGALVGGASLDALAFTSIAHAGSRRRGFA
jgi:triosephosphate isomerase